MFGLVQSLLLLSLNALAGVIPFNLIPFSIKLMMSFMICDCELWIDRLIICLLVSLNVLVGLLRLGEKG